MRTNNQIGIIGALGEGSSIRSIERMTGVTATATKFYAWSHDTDDPDQPPRHVTVLHTDPVTSPLLAIRAAILQEFRNAPDEA